MNAQRLVVEVGENVRVGKCHAADALCLRDRRDRLARCAHDAQFGSSAERDAITVGRDGNDRRRGCDHLRGSCLQIEALEGGRGGTSTLGIFNATFANADLLEIDERGSADGTGQFVSPASWTHVVAFPAGPLVGRELRVCAIAAANFWIFQGRVQIRGRLVDADPTFLPPSGGTRDLGAR